MIKLVIVVVLKLKISNYKLMKVVLNKMIVNKLLIIVLKFLKNKKKIIKIMKIN